MESGSPWTDPSNYYTRFNTNWHTKNTPKKKSIIIYPSYPFLKKKEKEVDQNHFRILSPKLRKLRANYWPNDQKIFSFSSKDAPFGQVLGMTKKIINLISLMFG